MIFRSYMDEAGTQTSDPFCSIAGYVAPVKEWDRFEGHWKFVLDEYLAAIPEHLRYFHALEFYENDKKYRSWSGAKRTSFENALFKTIRDHQVGLYMSCVDTRVFLSMTEDERRMLTGGVHNGMKWKSFGAPTKPYFMPFQFCIIQAANFVRNTDKIFAVMSRQEQYKIKALELYELMLNSEPALHCREKLADGLVFSDPKKVSALQAADLAVYWFSQLNRWRAKMNTGRTDGFPDLPKLMRLMDNAQSLGDFKMFDFQGLMLVLQACNRYIRTSFRTLDQQLPSLPLAKRKEVLGVMRRVNLRRFLDHETLTLQGGHG